jgi:head-tail adaptor
VSLLSLIQTRGVSINIERPQSVEDAMGTAKKTFVFQGVAEAYVASRSNVESFEGNRQIDQEIVTVYVRGGTDIKVTDRFTLDNVTYEVQGKRTPGMRREGDRNFYHIINAASDRGI